MPNVIGIRLLASSLCIAAALCFAVTARGQQAPQPGAAGTAGQQAPAPRVAGTIELVEGDVLIEGKDGSTRLPVVGEPVYEGDTLTSFAKSEVHLDMADGAQFILREDSKITLFEYVADGGSEDRSLIDLTRGALRAITGWIGQYNRSRYRVRTPLVTIGVRGTDHEPTHIPIGDPRGEPGSYDKVNDGAVFMETKQGIVEVPKNRAAFHSASAKAAPRLLGTVPRFYKPGRHEQRFAARAQQVRKTIPQRRTERQEIVRQRGEKAGAKGGAQGGAKGVCRARRRAARRAAHRAAHRAERRVGGRRNRRSLRRQQPSRRPAMARQRQGSPTRRSTAKRARAARRAMATGRGPRRSHRRIAVRRKTRARPRSRTAQTAASARRKSAAARKGRDRARASVRPSGVFWGSCGARTSAGEC
jgi:hypothetical protein